MTTTLSPEEKSILREILVHPASEGAFAGMVFNAVWNHKQDREVTDEDIRQALKTALRTRLIARTISKEDSKQ